MKKMKWIFVAIGLILTGNMMAQPRPADRKEKIEALKIAFISERLQLTSEEAKVFWPVYNKMEAEIKELRKKHKMRDDEENYEEMTEQEAEKELNEYISFKEAQLNLAKKYQSEFRKVLSSKKVLMLYRAEEDFKKQLLKKIRERRMNQNRGMR